MNNLIDKSAMVSINAFLCNCEVAANAHIGNYAQLENCTVLENAEIECFCVLKNVCIGKNTIVKSFSYLEDCTFGENCTVGPSARVRGGSKVGNGCRVGNFVELKNAVFENGVKCAHLSYVGDAFVGEKTNLGCGVVFANYDGKNKHKTIVGKNCFIGCNCNLVAPLEIADDCFVAAGTTVTKNLSENTFCIGRVRQEEKTKKMQNST